MTKLCTKCETEKETSEFTKDKRYFLGLFCWCKECKKKHARENPQIAVSWSRENKDRSDAIKNKYVAENREKVRESKRKWSKANNKQVLAKTRKYQASKLNATPSWLTKEQLNEMVAIYVNCPEGYHLDHIVPLQGKNVKGLHVPWNLCYLPASENSRKSNKY